MHGCTCIATTLICVTLFNISPIIMVMFIKLHLLEYMLYFAMYCDLSYRHMYDTFHLLKILCTSENRRCLRYAHKKLGKGAYSSCPV